MILMLIYSRSYSDDGSMTLALAKSFIDSKGSYNHELSIAYFLDWLFDGRFSTTSKSWDVGSSTGRSLSMWRECLRRKDVEDGQKRVDEALNRDQFSGNGSLMRISPVGLILHKNMNQAMDIANQQGRITHPAQACVDSTVLYTELMCRTIHGMHLYQCPFFLSSVQFCPHTWASVDIRTR